MTVLVGQFIVTDQIEMSSLRAGASVNLLSFGEERGFREVYLEGVQLTLGHAFSDDSITTALMFC